MQRGAAPGHPGAAPLAFPGRVRSPIRNACSPDYGIWIVNSMPWVASKAKVFDESSNANWQ